MDQIIALTIIGYIAIGFFCALLSEDSKHPSAENLAWFFIWPLLLTLLALKGAWLAIKRIFS